MIAFLLSISSYALAVTALLSIMFSGAVLKALPPAPWKQVLKDAFRCGLRAAAFTFALMILFIPTLHLVWRLYRGGK